MQKVMIGKMETENFTVEIGTGVRNERGSCDGFFEHHEYGDEWGGGLWIENGELSDYDGCGMLPKQVADAIVKMGYSLGDMSDDCLYNGDCSYGGEYEQDIEFTYEGCENE